MVNEQLASVIQAQGAGDLNKLLHSGDTWVVD
jgi:hypothetical protein